MKNFTKALGSVLLTLVVASSASAAMDDDAIRERTKPVGQVNIEGAEGVATAPAASGPRSGQEVYQAACVACHGSGALNAPKFGDAAAWGTRAAKGLDVLVKNAISGINMMPARGTCASCSDEEISAAIQYMLDNSK